MQTVINYLSEIDSITILGLIGGALTTTAFFPQVVKTWKTRSASDFSLVMLVLLTVGIFVWTIYGFLIYSIPVILANITSFFLCAIILVFKIKYK